MPNAFRGVSCAEQYGVGLDPLHVDLTIARWQRMTKTPAQHASGKTFAEVCHEQTARVEVDD